MEKQITLALVDDHQLFRKGISALIDDFQHLKILFEACHGKDLMDKLKKARPDVILMDIDMPVMDGFVATIEVKRKYPNIKIIVLTMHHEMEMIYNLIQSGANGFLNKNESVENVIEAINTVSENGFFLNNTILKAIGAANFKIHSNNKPYIYQPLSARETEVVKLICQQLTIKEIACKLNISPRTVDTYRENIFIKTNSKNIAGVVIYAIKNNIIN